MPYTRTYNGIILRTMDIHDADRFCILFTRESGRKAAKAKGVRKPNSRMGGLLMPFKRVEIDLAESDGYAVITSAVDRGGVRTKNIDYDVLVQLQQATELLLALTEDDEPLPKIFDLFCQFVELTVEGRDLLELFQLRLLHLLGLLPASLDDRRFALLPPASSAFIEAVTRIGDLGQLKELQPDETALRRFMTSVVEGQLQRPLKASSVQRGS